MGAGPKKPKEAGYDPLAMAQPLGQARNPNPPPSPTTSVSTVHSEATDGGPGPAMDKEVGDELAQIKECISGMDVNALPYAGQVGFHALSSKLLLPIDAMQPLTRHHIYSFWLTLTKPWLCTDLL